MQPLHFPSLFSLWSLLKVSRILKFIEYSLRQHLKTWQNENFLKFIYSHCLCLFEYETGLLIWWRNIVSIWWKFHHKKQFFLSVWRSKIICFVTIRVYFPFDFIECCIDFWWLLEQFCCLFGWWALFASQEGFKSDLIVHKLSFLIYGRVCKRCPRFRWRKIEIYE